MYSKKRLHLASKRPLNNDVDTNRYSKPNIQFFDGTVMVDNVAGEIIA